MIDRLIDWSYFNKRNCMQRVESLIKFLVQWYQISVLDYRIPTEDSVPVFDQYFSLHILFQIIQDILTGSNFFRRKLSRVYSDSDLFRRNLSRVYSDSNLQRRDQLNCVHRLRSELNQEVIELTENLCFLFCSTPTPKMVLHALLKWCCTHS